MTAPTVWTRTKAKIAMQGKRKLTVPALVSASAPGIALQEGEWADFKNSEGKKTLDISVGWKPFVLATGAAVGPVISTLEAASAYAVAVAALADWATMGPEAPPPVYAKVMRLWYEAADEPLTPEKEQVLAKLEGAAA